SSIRRFCVLFFSVSLFIYVLFYFLSFFFFFQAEDGIRDFHVTGVQTCALPISETGQTGPDEAGSGVGCGCPDYRTDVDLDLDFQDDAANVFPTGLYPEEWSENLKDDLGQAAEAIEDARIETELKEAKARVRARFTAPAPAPETTPAPA